MWGGRISVKSFRLATLMGRTKILGEKHGHVRFCPSIISHGLGRDWSQSLGGERVTNSLNRIFTSCICFLSHSKHYSSAKKTDWLMLFSEIFAVYWVNPTKYVNTLCRIFVSQQVIHAATKLLQGINKTTKSGDYVTCVIPLSQLAWMSWPLY